jgi:hypothetical protein
MPIPFLAQVEAHLCRGGRERGGCGRSRAPTEGNALHILVLIRYPLSVQRPPFCALRLHGPGRNRTCDRWIMSPLL